MTLLDHRSGYLAGGLAALRTKRDVADIEIAALSGPPPTR